MLKNVCWINALNDDKLNVKVVFEYMRAFVIRFYGIQDAKNVEVKR